MPAIKKSFRGVVVAATIAAMLSVSGCAWFQRAPDYQRIAYIATVFAATYILTIPALLASQPVTEEDVIVYRQIHHHRTLLLVADPVLLTLIVAHFNKHRALWWQLPIFYLILNDRLGERFKDQHHRELR